MGNGGMGPAQVFLLNYVTRKMLGPFKAASAGGLEIDVDAWARRGHRTPFPAQAKRHCILMKPQHA